MLKTFKKSQELKLKYTQIIDISTSKIKMKIQTSDAPPLNIGLSNSGLRFFVPSCIPGVPCVPPQVFWIFVKFCQQTEHLLTSSEMLCDLLGLLPNPPDESQRWRTGSKRKLTWNKGKIGKDRESMKKHQSTKMQPIQSQLSNGWIGSDTRHNSIWICLLLILC